MIINLSKKDEQELRHYLDIKEYNISAAEVYIDYFSDHYTVFEKKDVEKEGYYKAFLNALEIDENDDYFVELNKVAHIDKIDKLNPQKYLEDEYAKSVITKNVDNGNWILTHLHYLPYEGFVYDELEINDEYYQEHTPFGYFESKFPYIAVIEEDLIWMSVIPHEINTMRKPIKDAFGNVLVLGLGLGYFPFHIALKDDVDKITIIENDEKVISLFNDYIFPHFKNKDKIKVIHDDAFKYLDEHHDFDFVFADIWHNVGDGLPLYLKIKKYEDVCKNTKFEYWIETSMLAMLRRQTLTVIEEQYFEHLAEKEYLRARNDNDRIINGIYFALKDLKINSIDDIHYLLSEESLKQLAKRI